PLRGPPRTPCPTLRLAPTRTTACGLTGCLFGSFHSPRSLEHRLGCRGSVSILGQRMQLTPPAPPLPSSCRETPLPALRGGPSAAIGSRSRRLRRGHGFRLSQVCRLPRRARGRRGIQLQASATPPSRE